jgi:hypothetical protein
MRSYNWVPSAREMEHQSYADLLDRLVAALDGDYRSDPERNEARLDAIEVAVFKLLEKLRDETPGK